ncbi:hypothetical protein [Flaviaesturariibacter amylovorans]|uniref:Uncharacterized protein n=1 Tax=Flaviaesturariibacter amylovorans TaxID=1084520 RepID=A0ABP8G8J2_9BACT
MKLLPPSERSILRALYVLVFAAFLWAERASAPVRDIPEDAKPTARKTPIDTTKERPSLAARTHR